MANVVERKSIYPYVLISFPAVYFAAHESNGEISFVSSILKVLPIVYLIFFMISYLRSGRPLTATIRSGSEEGNKWSERQRLAKGVTYGLGFSLIGDISLMIFFSEVVKKVNSGPQPSEDLPLHLIIDSNDMYYLIGGVVAFGVAQICYIYAFGFRVVRVKIGLVLYVLAAVLCVFVLWNVPPLLKLFIIGYGALLTTSLWRALDRSKHNDGRSWVKRAFLPAGLLTFFVSDLWIGVSTFALTERSASSMYFIMATYYAAQGLIAAAAS